MEAIIYRPTDPRRGGQRPPRPQLSRRKLPRSALGEFADAAVDVAVAARQIRSKETVPRQCTCAGGAYSLTGYEKEEYAAPRVDDALRARYPGTLRGPFTLSSTGRAMCIETMQRACRGLNSAARRTFLEEGAPGCRPRPPPENGQRPLPDTTLSCSRSILEVVRSLNPSLEGSNAVT